jgi:hypothetical protein
MSSSSARLVACSAAAVPLSTASRAVLAPVSNDFLAGLSHISFPCRHHGTNELHDPVRRQLQDFACQMAVGEPKFIQNREVIRLCDRDQVAGEMRL